QGWREPMNKDPLPFLSDMPSSSEPGNEAATPPRPSSPPTAEPRASAGQAPVPTETTLHGPPGGGPPAAPGKPAERGLGDYRLVRELGRGGMGIVFEAMQESLGRKVALKVLRGTALLEEKAVRRFHREAETLANLRHPNIVPVYCVGEQNGTHYYAMELVEGLPLSRVIRLVRNEALGDADPFDPGAY